MQEDRLGSDGDNIDAWVLAGRRGPADVVAAAAGVTHRALVPVCGVPMLLRVVRTLRETPGVGRVTISIDDPGQLDSVPELAEARRAGWLATHTSLDSPSASVGDLLTRVGKANGVLVTTGDHPLLTPGIVGAFLAEARTRPDADVVVGMVPARVVRAAHPDAVRTFLALRGEAFSGANLFWMRAPGARRVTDFWRNAERHRKQPWKLVRSFGVVTLLLFLLRRLDLGEAMTRASRILGARVEAVELEDADAAIDVDKPSDLELATRILERRATSPRGAR